MSAAPGTGTGTDAQPGGVATAPPRPRRARSIRTNLIFFALTIFTTFYVGSSEWVLGRSVQSVGDWLAGWQFAVPLLFILLCHEFGHYLMARHHKVDASLPYFIPFPVGFGTLGAVIRMSSPSTRKQLIDIGAAGPLAGMVAAVPIMVLGLEWSTVGLRKPGFVQEGQSLLYMLVKRVVVGPIPATHDVWVHPVAMAAWVGFLITALNLLPVGQLDGGHVAYALLGKKQDRLSRVLQLSLVPLGLGLSLYHGLTGLAAGQTGDPLIQSFMMGVNWLVWAFVLEILRRIAGREHPPVEPGSLSLGRRVLAIGCLVLFVMLFTPVPLSATTGP